MESCGRRGAYSADSGKSSRNRHAGTASTVFSPATTVSLSLRFQAPFRHCLDQRRDLPLARLRLGEGFADLDEDIGEAASRDNEIDFLPCLRPVVVNLRIQSPQGREHEIFEKMA
jgi:hypothetical protein